VPSPGFPSLDSDSRLRWPRVGIVTRSAGLGRPRSGLFAFPSQDGCHVSPQRIRYVFAVP
jgi:hypothetical protein